MKKTQINPNSLKNLTYRTPVGSIPWNKGLSMPSNVLEKMRINQVIKNCEVCNKEYRIKRSHAHLRRSCSHECSAVIKSIEHSGKNHPMWGRKNLGVTGDKNSNWKGGITPKNKAIRNSAEFARWRKEVYKRDDYTCQKCLKLGGKLEAHHIKPFSLFKELRFEVSNGITLCKPCHKVTDSYGSKIINFIKNLNK